MASARRMAISIQQPRTGYFAPALHDPSLPRSQLFPHLS